MLLLLASASALLMSAAPPRVTVVGLGPGSASSITRGAWSALEQPGARVFLRTSQHPAVAALPCAFSTFDALYETSSKFEDVYASIADALAAAAAAESTPVVYAVPGDPCVGEQTVALLRGRADVVADVLPGVSFLEPSLAALGVDLLPATQIVDAVLVGARAYPPFEPRSAALLCQLYSRSLASEVKLCLLEAYPPQHPVILLHAAGTDNEQCERVPLESLDRSTSIAALTSLYIPPLADVGSLGELLDGVARLAEAELESAEAAYREASPEEASLRDSEAAWAKVEDRDWTGTSYRGLDDEGDDAEGGGLFSEALGGYAGPPNWEAVRAAAAHVVALQRDAEEIDPVMHDASAGGERLEGGMASLLLEVLKQTRRAHDDGWLADGDGRRVSGMGSVLAKAARQLQRQVEEAEAA